MICVAVVKGQAVAGAPGNDPQQIEQGNGQHDERDHHRPMTGMTRAVEVRQNCQDRQEIANQVAARIAEKGARLREIVRQKTCQRAYGQEPQAVLTLPLIVITLGLFLIIINAAMLALTAGLSSHLDIDNFGSAVLGGLVISFFSWILELLVPLGRRGTAEMTRSRGEDHRDAHR